MSFEEESKESEGSQNDEYKFKYLHEDAIGLTDRQENKCEGYPQPGYSILLFGTQKGKPVLEGDLFKKIFQNYYSIRNKN